MLSKAGESEATGGRTGKGAAGTMERAGSSPVTAGRWVTLYA